MVVGGQYFYNISAKVAYFFRWIVTVFVNAAAIYVVKGTQVLKHCTAHKNWGSSSNFKEMNHVDSNSPCGRDANNWG